MLRHQFHPLATVLAVLALAIGGLGILLAVERDVFPSPSGLLGSR